MKLVRDYMKKKVVTFKPNDSIFTVAKMLSKHGISGAPVVRSRKVVGVISKSDIIRYMRLKMPEENASMLHEIHALSILMITMIKDHLEFKRELLKMSKIKVSELMSKDVVSISPQENIIEAATMMERHTVERLPVIDRGRLVGIIARSDLIRALIE